MSDDLQFTMVNEIKCYSPEVGSTYADYPHSGFDLTDENAKNSFWVSSRNRLFGGLVRRHLLSKGTTNFLEIGCGTGNFIQQISDEPNLKITGSEIYLKGLEYAKRNLPQAEFIQFDITQGKLSESFDIIAAFDVIEHIEADQIALSNMSKMLNKDGVLIVSVPQHMFLWSRLDDIVKHKRRYSRLELVRKLAKNEFEVTYVTSFVFFLFPLMWASRLFDKSSGATQVDEQALESRVTFPKWLNAVFDLLMRVDESLIKLGIQLPFGGTLVAVAKKKMKLPWRWRV
jgi:SAM-dependent methyltransferase